MNLISLLEGTSIFNGHIGAASGIKLLRHKNPSDLEIERRFKYEQPYIEAFQAVQSTDIFNGVHTILSFIGEQGNRAIFRGAWAVNGRITREQFLKQYEFGKEVLENEDAYNANLPVPRLEYSYYNTSSISLLSDLVDRLVIDWGRGVLAWHQWLSSKEVAEIFPSNYVSEFTGYYDLMLSYQQLRTLISNPVSNRIWHQQLSSVSAVYLILDKTTGKQYVGSAYGKNGLWGRWETYAADPSGGNKLLIELLKEKGKKHADQFQFSILRILESNSTREQVFHAEQVEKLKLGARVFGLNIN